MEIVQLLEILIWYKFFSVWLCVLVGRTKKMKHILIYSALDSIQFVTIDEKCVYINSNYVDTFSSRDYRCCCCCCSGDVLVL